MNYDSNASVPEDSILNWLGAMRDYQRQRQMTLGDLLLENRVIFLQGEIYDGNANELVMKLLYLQSENRRKDIHFYINSPGGSVTSTLAIYDTMQMISPPVSTYCVGLSRQRRGRTCWLVVPKASDMPEALQGDDSPAPWWSGRPGFGYRNPSQRDSPYPRNG